MSSFKKIIFLLGFMGVLGTAQASFLIEPHLGYNVSGGQASYNGAKLDYSGLQYGARLGMQYLGLMGGFAYNHGTFDLKETTIASGASVTGAQKQDDIGLFVGYNAPILLRAWLGYFFSSKMTQTETNGSGTNGDWYKGTVTEIGVGFTPLPLVSLNLVYRMGSFDKTYNAATSAESSLATDYKPTEIVIGVSLPFTLL